MIGGDLIIAIDGDSIGDQQDLANAMNKHRAGDTVDRDHLSRQAQDGCEGRTGRSQGTRLMVASGRAALYLIDP